MKKTIIPILLIALTLAQNTIFDKHQKEQNFLNFTKRNGKKYDNLEESLYRFSIYKDNLKKIEQLNKENPNTTFAENQFTDLTQEEFLATRTGAIPPVETEDRKLDSASHTRNLGSYPASIDLRTTKGIQPIGDQGSCSSCWAFSAISTIEYAYWKNTNQPTNLSEQQLVDCVYTTRLGCTGGWTHQAYDYIKNLPGIAYEKDYQYTGKDGVCKDIPLIPKMWVWLNFFKSYESVANDDDAIKSAIANIGVLSVNVDASNWSSYQQGIFTDPRLNDQNVQPIGNHLITLVGYGTENGIPYYIVRNSWGTNWGEQGYMKADARRRPDGNTYSGLLLNYVVYPIIYNPILN